MNLEDFQFVDKEKTESSNINRDVLKLYHQPAANLKDYIRVLNSYAEKN